jgi:integrase
LSLLLSEMATIYKRAESPFFYAAFTNGQGKRIYRSTGTRIKEEAQEITAKWVREAKRQKKDARDGQGEIADIVAKIGQLANKGELTELKAREAIIEIFEASSGQKMQLFTVEEWLKYWAGLHSKTESPSTTESRNRSIAHILEALGKNASKRLDLVTSGDLEEVKRWLDNQKSRSGQIVRRSTQNIKLAHLRAAFEEARVRSVIPSNPARAIKNFTQADSQIVGDFDGAELQKLVNAADGEWRDLIILAAHTGLRRENLLRLKWSEVNIAKRCLFVALVKVKDGHTKKVATIPLTLDALEAVQRNSGKSKQFVFEELSKLGKTEPNRIFERIMAKAEVPRVVIGNGDVEMKRSFHSLRHTFCSLLANQSIPAEVRQPLTGHADAAVHKLYSHLDDEVLQGATETIPRLQWQGAA